MLDNIQNNQLHRHLNYLLSKDALMASLSYFFPLPPDFLRPLWIIVTIFLLVQEWLWLKHKQRWPIHKVTLPKVWKSPFRFSCWWGLIWLLWNKTAIISNTAGTPALYLPYCAVQTFDLLALAFGLPLLCSTHKSRSGIWWHSLFWRYQWASTTLNTVSQWGWWAAGELCLTPKSISVLSRIIFLSISRKANRHREGKALLDGPPPPGRFLLLLLLRFLKEQN